MVWQLAFVMIGLNPTRFRPLMLLAVLEKAGFVATLLVLFVAGRVSALDVQAALPDGALAVMFVAAFVATKQVEL